MMIKDESWASPAPVDPNNLVKYRDSHKIERSTLRGATRRRIAELRAMYDLQPPEMQKMLRAVRARRAIDVIDVFHATVKHEWDVLTDRERVLMSKISVVTTRMQRKLQGHANPHP
jgi:hypothetical protein